MRLFNELLGCCFSGTESDCKNVDNVRKLKCTQTVTRTFHLGLLIFTSPYSGRNSKTT